ncbi:MAG TPA: glycerate kinase [Capillimicrobium sp.]|nr:glycerate kinase [Capillimicrobium sp.]
MILVAPDSFKGTFSAVEVAGAIARGAESAGARANRCPVADGGEGTMDVVLGALGGTRVEAPAHDPLGRPIVARIGLLDGGATAIVEAAQASGLHLVAPGERDPEAASTGGTGELIAAAARTGARRIVVTVGGSATTDGGLGAVEALEAAGGLGGAEVVVACDVTTPYELAAEVYGPQKGADAATVSRLTARLHERAAALPRDPRGRPRTGAAGGLSGALWAVYGARLVAGADWVLDAVGFDARLGRAALVVTGEGRLDAQTLEGKAVAAVAARARRAGVPVHAVVGTSAVDAAGAAALGLASVREAPSLGALEAAGAALAETALGAGR